MSTVEEIEQAIEKLPAEDYQKLRAWMSEREEEAWDRQIEADYDAGRLDHVLAQVKADIAAGLATDL